MSKWQKMNTNIIDIGDIGNYYGGLSVMGKNGKYYWIIENHNTHFADIDHWSEIDKELYDALIAYETRRIEKEEKEQND